MYLQESNPGFCCTYLSTSTPKIYTHLTVLFHGFLECWFITILYHTNSMFCYVCMYVYHNIMCIYIYINNNKNRDDNTNDDKHSNSNPNKKSNNIIYSIIFIYLHIMKICFHSLIYHSYFPADPPGIPGGGMPGGMPGIPGGTMPLRFAFSDLSKAKKNYWGVEQTTDYFWGVDLLIFFW